MQNDNEKNVTLTPLNQFHHFCQLMYFIIDSYMQNQYCLHVNLTVSQYLSKTAMNAGSEVGQFAKYSITSKFHVSVIFHI